MSSCTSQEIMIRTAVEADVPAIYQVLAAFAEQRLLLPRPQMDILLQIDTFHVACVNGEVAGCAALRDYGNELYEVRSLAVSEKFQNMGLASMLVTEQMNILAGKNARLFALTYRDNFFQRLGFRVVEKTLFPEKIWSDCERCPKKDHCDEIAVLMELA